jgi:hypothetical protein
VPAREELMSIFTPWKADKQSGKQKKEEHDYLLISNPNNAASFLNWSKKLVFECK